MLYDLLKIANSTNINRTVCLFRKASKALGSYNHKSIRLKHDGLSDTEKKKIKEAQSKSDPCRPSKPPLDCPWEDVEKGGEKKYKKYALVGILVAAATIGFIMFFGGKGEKEIKKHLPTKPTRKYLRPKPTCKIPKNKESFPKHVPYLLIGGGTASFAAFRAIKSSDPKAKVLVISNECHNPYMRPPLSKELWYTENEQSVNNLVFRQWTGSERSLFYEPDDFYTSVESLSTKENGGVAVALGYKVTKIDVVERKACIDDTIEIGYDKCLIATGAKPVNMPVFAEALPEIQDRVTLFREVFDFHELNEICGISKKIAIVGGGFLGSELACALARKGKNSGLKVYQILKDKGNLEKVLPEYLSAWTTEKVRSEGVVICPQTEIEDVTLNEKDKLLLHLNNGSQLDVDHVIVAVGVEPNTQLARTSELEIDPVSGGFLVNAELQARSHLYIAGDCSSFYDTKLGRRRVEHHDHAVVSGRLAGENMTGATKPFTYQSMFWSDLGPNVGFEAIGIVDASLPTVGVFAKKDGSTKPGDSSEEEESASQKLKDAPPGTKDKHDSTNENFDKGIIFYLKEDTVVGIVLWNIFNRMPIARQVLKDQRKYDDLNEVAKLFNIHDQDKQEREEAMQ